MSDGVGRNFSRLNRITFMLSLLKLNVIPGLVSKADALTEITLDATVRFLNLTHFQNNEGLSVS